MKKTLLLFATLLLVVGGAAASGPRYVFYFIGDGMGPNAVTLTEAYLAGTTQGDKIGFTASSLSNLTVYGYATTHSANRRITDSAAAGTALATGQKTSVGTIGMDSSDTKPLMSIAYDAQRSGRRVGITTSVSIDHATPASFFAHQADRNMSYEIAMEAPKAGFEFYAGSGFLNPTPEGKPSLWEAFDAAGYKTIRSGEVIGKSADKVLLLQPEGAAADALPLAIDAQEKDLTLAEITRSAINHLDNKAGFFLMVEGGQIDWAAHSNDAGSLIHEVIDFAKAIDVALEFYRAHPKETLIVITADHETGGLALGQRSQGYDSAVELLDAQGCSLNVLERLMASCADWAEARATLESRMGFGSKIAISDKQWQSLEATYAKRAKKVASEAVAILTEKSGVAWTTGSHTSATVPVYAIGKGAETFTGRQDNMDIAQKLRKLMTK